MSTSTASCKTSKRNTTTYYRLIVMRMLLIDVAHEVYTLSYETVSNKLTLQKILPNKQANK